MLANGSAREVDAGSAVDDCSCKSDQRNHTGGCGAGDGVLGVGAGCWESGAGRCLGLCREQKQPVYLSQGAVPAESHLSLLNCPIFQFFWITIVSVWTRRLYAVIINLDAAVRTDIIPTIGKPGKPGSFRRACRMGCYRKVQDLRPSRSF